MPEQGIRHNISHLKETHFFQNDSDRQNNFRLLVRELHNEFSVSISVKITCFQHLQQGFYEKPTLGYFGKSTYSQMHCRLQPWCLFGTWLLRFVLQVEISHFHITSHILFAKAVKYLWRKWLRKFCFGE